MTRIFTLLIISLIFISAVDSFSRDRKLPLYVQPEKALTEDENQFLGKIISQKLIGRQTQPELLKMKPGPDRILNADGFELINASRAPLGQHETWIAINKQNPDVMIATSNDSRYLQQPPLGYRMVAFCTSDRGKTWTETTTPYNQDIYIELPDQPWQMTIFDPGIAFDTQGWAFYSYGFTQIVQTGQDQNGVFVCRSSDGGLTWEEPIPVVLEVSGNPKPFHDRYTIACDDNLNSPNRDYLYITWKRFIVGNACLFSRSKDNGLSWSKPIVLPGSNKPGTQAPMPAVGPNGEVYVAWQDPDDAQNTTDAVFQKSTDAGATWLSIPKVAQKVTTCGVDMDGRNVLENKQNIRVSSPPQIAVDLSSGPRRGWIYIVQAGKDASGKYGIWLARSTDGGNNWSKNNRIDASEIRNDMVFPSITVDPTNGNVALFYYSSQNDPENVGFDGYLAFSSDGINFTNIRLTPQTWYLDRLSKVIPQGEPNNIYWGDYTSITAYNGKIYPLFWMPSPINGTADNLELFTAEISAAPKAPTNQKAVSNSQNPTEMNLSWTDPVQSLLGTPLGTFTIVITRDGAEIAQVPGGTQAYKDTGLQDGKSYTYGFRAVNNDGSSTEVYASGFAGSSPTPSPATSLVAKPNKDGCYLQWVNPSTHIDGSDFYDFSAINIYSNGELIEKIETGLEAGKPASALIEVELKKFYDFQIAAVGKRDNIETESMLSNIAMSYAGEPIEDFTENFDNSSALIPAKMDGTWAISSEAKRSDPNCLTDSPGANYKAGDYSVLFAPTVISETRKVLGFWHIALIDPGLSDNGVVAISNDFGATWRDLRWFDQTSSEKFKATLAESDWDYFGLDLSEFVSDTVYIKYRIFANQFKHMDGWYIDDISIGDNPVSVNDLEIRFNEVNLSVSPNPAAGNANVNFRIPNTGNYDIRIYDLLGNSVKNIHSGYIDAGNYDLPVDISGISSGHYYVVLRYGKLSKSVSLIVE